MTKQTKVSRSTDSAVGGVGQSISTEIRKGEHAMKKVVINKCFGGFGLSDEAEKALVGKCEHMKLCHVKEYFGGTGKFASLHPDHNWEKEWKESLERDQRYASIGAGNNYHDAEHVICDEHRNSDRDCPALVEVVERMGEKANGRCAELMVVEIPADVKFEIDEYDGLESVHERHRSWG